MERTTEERIARFVKSLRNLAGANAATLEGLEQLGESLATVIDDAEQATGAGVCPLCGRPLPGMVKAFLDGLREVSAQADKLERVQ